MTTHTKQEQLYNYFKDQFPYPPTQDQLELFNTFAAFILSPKNDTVFVLKGYAGTGKTSGISHVINKLNKWGRKFKLLAPTGRAAKVLSNYAGFPASTIHKKIYNVNTQTGGWSFLLKKNTHTNTLFFVDESSMLSHHTEVVSWSSRQSLLEDLIDYVYQGTNCRLVLIGDTAQLPPVKAENSPALDEYYLQSHFNKQVVGVTLKEVVRQTRQSGILMNATRLRTLIAQDNPEDFKFTLSHDVIRPADGYEIEDALQQSYYNHSVEDTLFIVRSNKRANLYNRQIRQQLLDLDSDLVSGDYIMVVKNNYFWLDKNSEAGFIANGDMAEVINVYNHIELYGFKFADATLRLIDYPDLPVFEAKIILNTLDVEAAHLPYEDLQTLYREISLDYADLNNKKLIREKVISSPFFNALQVKHTYAVTCHKSQGGQWANVFIEKPYLPEGQNKNYLRWLYTALTRAQRQVYLIGFSDDDFEN